MVLHSMLSCIFFRYRNLCETFPNSNFIPNQTVKSVKNFTINQYGEKRDNLRICLKSEGNLVATFLVDNASIYMFMCSLYIFMGGQMHG